MGGLVSITQGVDTPTDSPPASLGGRVDDALSTLVDRAIPRSADALTGWLVAALVFQLAVHGWGLLSACANAGELHHNLQVATAHRLDTTVANYGEVQPLGVLQEAATFAVTVLLVGWLTGAVRTLRDRGGADGLPRQLWRVALRILVRPRRAVDVLWERTGGPSGGWAGALLDVLWPVWLLSGLAMQFGDHLGARADTLADGQTATRVHIGAEIGLLATTCLLLWLVVGLAERLRGSRSVAPGVAVGVVSLVLAPAFAVGGAVAYERGSSGPTVEQVGDRLEAQASWEAHEQAAASGKARAVRRTAAGPVLREDLAGLRRQRRTGRRVRFARQLQGVTPLAASSASTRMLGIVGAQGTSSWVRANPALTFAIVAFTRSRPGAAWKVLMEVPLTVWPWRDAAPATAGDPAPGGTAAAAALGWVLGARRATDVVAVPLRSGRTLACGAARAAQSCVVLDRDGKVAVLGRG